MARVTRRYRLIQYSQVCASGGQFRAGLPVLLAHDCGPNNC